MRKPKGYTLLILALVIVVMSIGLMVAVPVWRTQIQREKEEELIFRGKQYVEAIRLFQAKYPGRFPKNLKELYEERCLRKLFPDPMTAHGQWDIILQEEGVAQEEEGSLQKVLIVPERFLSSLQNPLIIGVVSSSIENSIRIYYDNESYDKWLFYYGQDPSQMPEIIYFGQPDKD
jgi:type II secretory pathway pseudopilin PulG